MIQKIMKHKRWEGKKGGYKWRKGLKSNRTEMVKQVYRRRRKSGDGERMRICRRAAVKEEGVDAAHSH